MIARWQRLVAFRKALDLLHWAMRAISYPRAATAIETASKVGTFYIIVLFAVALVAAGAIWSKKLLDGGVQWLPV